MLKAAEMLGRQAQTSASAGDYGDLGGFASLDLTNTLPTLDFTLDYAPPVIDETLRMLC